MTSPSGKGTSLDKFPKSWGILYYPGFEVLDAQGPLEALNCLVTQTQSNDMTLSIISRNLDPVVIGDSPFESVQKYLPTHTFETAPQLEGLLIPGGIGSIDFMPGLEKNNVDDYIEYVHKAYNGYDDKKPLKYIMSVCNGAHLLTRAGILDGRKATTNKDYFNQITAQGPKTHWISHARWITDGNVWTSSGVSAGVDCMLAFMDSLLPKKLVDDVTATMEWNRAESADNDPFAEWYGVKDVLPKA